MIVEDIMVREIFTVGPETPIREIARVLVDNKISGVPVVDQDGTMVGIISEKTILHKLHPGYDNLYQYGPSAYSYDAMEEAGVDVTNQTAKDIMISPVISVTPQAPIMRASALMIANRIRRLPVLDNGKLVGIISSGDVCYEIFKKAFHLE